MPLKTVVFLALGVVTAVYVSSWFASFLRFRRRSAPAPADHSIPTVFQAALGFITNFFDALGVGSFAPTTSVFKLRKIVPDERIPGTLNVGHALPTIAQAFIFIALVEVDMTTLLAMIFVSVLGAWLGAGIVRSWPRRTVQLGMGLALLAAATFFSMTNLGLFPSGGDTLELEGLRLAFGLAGNFLLGALMTLGIGLYAPCMILVSLLGMNPKAAFPIMMGSCAFLMPVGGLRFIAKGSYSLGPALGLTLGGLPGVLVAAYLVKSLPLTTLRWLVVAVVLYAAFAMLRSVSAQSARVMVATRAGTTV
ncbi:MAG TPA: sulfite exporter TauE/SafE family protein [Vicinamibacteria bacterium]|nr:sulfite exporter TauE/SafE family protein [Vicinamibacteria bacterium]